MIVAHSHPPYGRRYSDSTKQRRVNLLVDYFLENHFFYYYYYYYYYIHLTACFPGQPG